MTRLLVMLAHSTLHVHLRIAQQDQNDARSPTATVPLHHHVHIYIYGVYAWAMESPNAVANICLCKGIDPELFVTAFDVIDNRDGVVRIHRLHARTDDRWSGAHPPAACMH